MPSAKRRRYFDQKTKPSIAYAVFGMRRSGHHAVAHWLYDMGCKCYHYNCAQADLGYRGVFVYHGDEIDSAHDQESFTDARLHIISTENKTPSAVMDVVQAWRPSRVVGVIRDPWNNAASHVAKWSQKSFDWPMWCHHALAFLGCEPSPAGEWINYNEWAGTHSRLHPSGKGSSFDRKDYLACAEDMAVHSRWKTMLNNPAWRRIATQEKVIELGREIWPDLCRQVEDAL